MRPLYWILIIIGVVATGVAITLIITKRSKDDKKNEDIDENLRLAYGGSNLSSSSNCYGCDGKIVGGVCNGNIVKVPCKGGDAGTYTF